MLKENIHETTSTTTLEAYASPSSTVSRNSVTAQSYGLFEHLKSNFFNEMRDDRMISGQTCENIEHWLSQHNLDELKALNQRAKEHFLYSFLY